MNSPFLIPTLSLRFTTTTTTTTTNNNNNNNKMTTNITSSSRYNQSTSAKTLSNKPAIRIPMPSSIVQKTQLDDETRDRLSCLIYEKENQNHDESIFDGGDFTLIKSFKGVLGLRTYPILDVITLERLVRAKITVRDLLENHISMTTLKSAGILDKFQDLQALRFEYMDLVRNRDLFSVNTIMMFFAVDIHTFYATEKSFSMDDISQCKFYACELETLKFNIQQLLDAGKLTKYQMFKAVYSPMEWMIMGLKRGHMRELKISHPEATRVGNGLGWSEQEYQSFAHPDKK
jgi:hypothetical protein